MMEKINKEDSFDKADKERLKSLRNKDKFECAKCANQTFILVGVWDFPFFDCICSQCGCLHIRR
jgi:hypothetical protein